MATVCWLITKVIKPRAFKWLPWHGLLIKINVNEYESAPYYASAREFRWPWVFVSLLSVWHFWWHRDCLWESSLLSFLLFLVTYPLYMNVVMCGKGVRFFFSMVSLLLEKWDDHVSVRLYTTFQYNMCNQIQKCQNHACYMTIMRQFTSILLIWNQTCRSHSID